MSIRSGLVVGLTALALLVAPTAAADPLTTVTATASPTISGTAQVGATLTAAPPTWEPVDAATTSYTWLRNGDPIVVGTEPTLTLTSAEQGAVIAVEATGHLDGWTDGTSRSVPTIPVAAGTITVVSDPMVTGTPRVGSTLTAHPPTWSSDWVATEYQWLRDGGPIAGATGSTRKLGATDVGARLAVRATGSADGYADTTVESAATAPVSKIRPTVTVRGTSAKVGALRLSITVAAVPDAAPTTTVRVKEGSRVLVSGLKVTRGHATFTKTKIKPGRHTYTVRYAGTNRIAAVTTSAVVQIKAKAKPSIKVTPKPGVKKIKLAIAVTVGGKPQGGSVSVKEGSKTLKSRIKLSQGRASWSASGVRPGRHTYQVGYSGTSQVRSGSTVVTVRVKAPVKVVSFPNCAALNAVYPHGVGRAGAKDHTTGAPPVTNFLVNTALYNANTGRDRDQDGVACERH